MKIKYKKVFLNRNAFNSPWPLLQDVGLISIDKDGNLHGKRGLSKEPRWGGSWEGWYWSNSYISLSKKGFNIFKENSFLIKEEMTFETI